MTILGAMTTLVIAGFAAPASAVVIEGPCTGSVTFEDGVNVTTFESPNTVTESHPLSPTITIPLDATVKYEGSMNIAPPSDLVDFVGGVDLKVPLIGNVTVVNWPDPYGQTLQVSDSGSYTYSLPSYIPKGTGGIEVTAWHTQMGTTCTVALNIAIAGESSIAGIVTGLLAAGFGALMVAAGIKKKES